MSTPSNKNAAADLPAEPATPHHFEAILHGFWQKNRNAILALCVLALLAVAVRGGWELFTAQREKSIAADYVAATTSEKLHDFAHLHQGSTLAGVAHLRLADEEYAAGNYPDAGVDYTQAATALAGTPFAGRAQLGAAIAKIQAGRAADGEAQLKQIADNPTLLKVVQAEAAYDLASLAADEGRADDAKKFAAQVQRIDPDGVWARRAIDLTAKQP
jgi:predicted negative regulator of RcsB-dependent stress response